MIVVPKVDLRAAGASPSRASLARPAVPNSAARELADLGFGTLLVTDGGSASNGPSHFSAVEELLHDTSARVQVMGARTTNEVEQLLRAGAGSVVLGDRGIEEPEWLAAVADLYPDAVAVATAVRDRRVVRRGWVRTLPVDIIDLVDELNALPLAELLITVPALDGAMRFGELALLEDVVERSRCPVFVAGGAATINDLRALEHRGIAGAVIDADKLLGDVIDARAVAREFGA